MQVQTITREQLISKARELAEQPHPMQADISSDTEEFLSRLGRYDGATVVDIRQNASEVADLAAAKKSVAQWIIVASAVSTVSSCGYLLFGGGVSDPVGVAIGVATMAGMATNLWAQRQESVQRANEQDARDVVATLDSWTKYLDQQQPPQAPAALPLAPPVAFTDYMRRGLLVPSAASGKYIPTRPRLTLSSDRQTDTERDIPLGLARSQNRASREECLRSQP